MSKQSTTPQYKLGKKLGEGAFGTVFECYDYINNRKLAVKFVHRATDVLSREFEVLQELKDTRHCVKMLDCFFTKTGTVSYLNIMLEFIESDLQIFINNMKISTRLSRLQEIKMIAYQMFKGLAELEERFIMHRDLKPENILFGQKKTIKIADFGNSKFFKPKKHNSPYNVTQYYRAPELFLCYCDYDNKIDVWAAGCIVAELVWLEPFFKGQSEESQYFSILKTLGSLSQDDKDFYYHNSHIDKQFFTLPKVERDFNKLNRLYEKFGDPEIAKNFFDRLFQMNPHKRACASDLLKDPFFNQQRLEYTNDFESIH